MYSESFGNDERGIRRFTRVEASELKEGQRTVLRKFSKGRWKRIKSGHLRWRQRKCQITCFVGNMQEHWDRKYLNLKKMYMEDETGDALALLIVMFYLSTLSLHN